MPQLNLFGGYYTSVSKPLSVQNSINLIPIAVESPALNTNALIGSRGIEQFATCGTQYNRGAIVMDGIPYFVNGNRLYKVLSDGTSEDLGIISGFGRVSMAHNGSKLCIVVPSLLGYVYDGSSLSQITDPNFLLASTVVYKDGFFIFTSSDGTVFFNSLLNDPTSFDALDFGTAEIATDGIVSQIVNHNELFIFGKLTTELFQTSGGSGFPFQRINGAVIEKGCFAKFTPINFDNTVIFLGGGAGEGAAIWRVASSQNAVKISTDALDNEIQSFSSEDISNAFTFSFAYDGQFMFGITFTSTNSSRDSATYCFNGTSQQWFQLRSGLSENRWRVNSVVTAYDKLMCGDGTDGRIGVLSNVRTEYGGIIKRERTTQPFIIDGKSQYYPEIELTIESGVGLSAGLSPQVRMSYSDDGGRTFSKEQSRSFGKVGEYANRSIWRRNGRVPNNRVLRFTITDPVTVNIIRLDANIEQGYG